MKTHWKRNKTKTSFSDNSAVTSYGSLKPYQEQGRATFSSQWDRKCLSKFKNTGKRTFIRFLVTEIARTICSLLPKPVLYMHIAPNGNQARICYYWGWATTWTTSSTVRLLQEDIKVARSIQPVWCKNPELTANLCHYLNWACKNPELTANLFVSRPI